MIIQGSNVPITLTLDTDVSTIPTLVATLWSDSKMIKKWEKSEMTIDSNRISLPLTQPETSAMSATKHIIDIKGLDSDGTTLFWDEAVIAVVGRRDKNITLENGDGDNANQR